MKIITRFLNKCKCTFRKVFRQKGGFEFRMQMNLKLTPAWTLWKNSHTCYCVIMFLSHEGVKRMSTRSWTGCCNLEGNHVYKVWNDWNWPNILRFKNNFECGLDSRFKNINFSNEYRVVFIAISLQVIQFSLYLSINCSCYVNLIITILLRVH